MTVEQLLQLGTRQVVYLKAGLHDGEVAFVLYRADGIPLVAVDDMETAVEMVPRTVSVSRRSIERKSIGPAEAHGEERTRTAVA